jgi:hypothetical protein
MATAASSLLGEEAGECYLPDVEVMGLGRILEEPLPPPKEEVGREYEWSSRTVSNLSSIYDPDGLCKLISMMVCTILAGKGG